MVNNDNSSKDSEIQNLLDKLCDLAMEWRGQVEKRPLIEVEYKRIYEQLSLLGWDDGIDLDCQIPSNHMPQDYSRRHPFIPTKGIWPHSWRSNKIIEDIEKKRKKPK